MAKKTKTQVYDAWISKQEQRRADRQADPKYQKIIRKRKLILAQLSRLESQLRNIRSYIHSPLSLPVSIPMSDPRAIKYKAIEAQIKTVTKKKASVEKELVDTFGPADVLENPSDVELKMYDDFEPDVNPFHDIWVVKPVLWAWKNRFRKVNKSEYRINWKAYLDSKGFVRFRIRTDNPGEVITEKLATWLDLLKDNKVITFKRGGGPSVTILCSLNAQEGIGAIVKINPFAPKGQILRRVIQSLVDHGFVLSRKDSFRPERMKALKLQKEGKVPKEIAFMSWPEQYKAYEENVEKEADKPFDLTAIMKDKQQAAIECPKYNKCLNKALKDNLLMLCGGCPRTEGVFIRQNTLSGKPKPRTNPLIIKAYRLLKK